MVKAWGDPVSDIEGMEMEKYQCSCTCFILWLSELSSISMRSFSPDVLSQHERMKGYVEPLNWKCHLTHEVAFHLYLM